MDQSVYGNNALWCLNENRNMESIQSGINDRRKARRGYRVHHSLRTDMTPMVDLGFLLITFFVITAEMTKPAGINLYMPTEGPPMPVNTSHAITFY